MRKILIHIPSIITALLIMYLSLSEQIGGAARLYRFTPHFDKIAHFGMYFVLTLVLIVSYRNYISCRLQILLLALGLFLYGALMEILQKYVTVSRHFEWWDMAANMAGIIAALILLWFVTRFFPEKSQSKH